MAKVAHIQTSFGGGEYGPLVQGRLDAERIKIGLATCLNYIPMLEGPLVRRPGTKYVAPAKESSLQPIRLVPFEFSTTQAYVLEFGNQNIRFYKDHAAILESGFIISNITNANPGVVTAVGHGYSAGNDVEISGVGGMTEVNNRRFKVANVTANTFELQGVDTTSYGAFTVGGLVGRVYELGVAAVPYAPGHLFQMRFAQSADTMYIVHPSYAPRKLTRTGHTAWTLSEIDFLDGPYLPTNATATTMTLGATSGATTITASAPVFAPLDVGRLVRWKDPAGNWTWLKITGYTSTTVVNATIRGPNASAVTATTNWRLGVWSATTGYPAGVTFFDDRLWFGGPTSYPQRIDGSNTGDYENFAPTAANGTVGDANAVGFTLNATDVNVIRWLRSDEKGLLVGTVGAEWVVRASAEGQAITPTNISAKPSTRHGSADIDPVQAGKATLFVQRAKRKLREFIYILDEEGFGAPDMTQLSAHITAGGLTQLAYQQEPVSVIWGTRADGVLLGVTYDRSADTLNVGWHRHVLGGASTAGGAAPVVESIAVIPSLDGTRDELWLLVKRYINGQTVRYVEYMTKIFDEEDAQEDAFLVDCGLTYDGAPATTISGMWHLEGQEISVFADGAVRPNVTVTNGSVTLGSAASVVQLGYNYNSDGKTLRPDAGAADGTAMGKTKRINRIGFLFNRTSGFKYGRDFDNLNTVNFRKTSDPMSAAVPLFTGVKSLEFDGGYDMDGQVCWRQDQPTPGAIMAVFPQMTTQDR